MTIYFNLTPAAIAATPFHKGMRGEGMWAQGLHIFADGMSEWEWNPIIATSKEEAMEILKGNPKMELRACHFDGPIY